MIDTARFSRMLNRLYAGRAIKIYTLRGDCYSGVLFHADGEYAWLAADVDGHLKPVRNRVLLRDILGMSWPDLAAKP